MERHSIFNPVISHGVNGISERIKAVKINGWIFESPREVTDYFSYSGAHILEGTVMAGGGYNAQEHVDGSVLSRFLHVANGLSEFKKAKGIPSRAYGVRKKLETAFNEQNPVWSGKIGGNDLREKLGWYKLGELMGVVVLVVEFTIKHHDKTISFTQNYHVGIQKNPLGKVGAIMVGTRKFLYHAYREAYGEEYPIGKTYPQVSIWQKEWDISELRSRYNLPPLES